MQEMFPSTLNCFRQEKLMLSNKQWTMPTVQRCNRLGLYTMLPPGIPDCLSTEIIHSIEGTERCTAAVYGGKVYLIHYAFKKHDDSPVY